MDRLAFIAAQPCVPQSAALLTTTDISTRFQPVPKIQSNKQEEWTQQQQYPRRCTPLYMVNTNNSPPQSQSQRQPSKKPSTTTQPESQSQENNKVYISDSEQDSSNVELKVFKYGKGAVATPLVDPCDQEPLLNVVFVRPQIHWNTGAIGRTCLGFSARLHLVGPLGFSLDDKHVKRGGLDYWSEVDLRVYDTFDSFIPTLQTFPHRYYFTKFANTSMLDVDFSHDASDGGKIALIFGSEIDGFTPIKAWLHENEDPKSLVAYPMNCPEKFRSFNLSTSAAMALWDAYKSVSSLQRVKR